MNMECHAPAEGPVLQELKDFLQGLGLDWDEGNTFTALMRDDSGRLIATASLDGHVVKCVGVLPAWRGGAITGQLMTRLREEAHSRGAESLLLYTRPEHQNAFERLGFYLVEKTDDVMLMEDRPDGVARWLETLPRPQKGIVGAIVANCNPMTNGHLYLIQKARLLCDQLYLFVVSEEKSEIPAADRLEIVRQATADMPGVVVCPSGDYLVSAATFPDYFLPDQDDAQRLGCELDLKLFAHQIAAPLGISRRFVGQEPYSPLTSRYNLCMKEILPEYGVSLVEFSRLRAGDKGYVNAATVRQLWRDGWYDALTAMVPDASLSYMKAHPIAEAPKTGYIK